MRPAEHQHEGDNEEGGRGNNLESHNNSIEIGRNQSSRSNERRKKQQVGQDHVDIKENRSTT
jgi:hypothetical protein